MERESLRNLPESADREFWEHADTELIELGDPKECEHSFIHRTANEVECKSCHAGFFLNAGWYIKDGHIYNEDGFVI